MRQIPHVDRLAVEGRKVLLRLDLNVPLGEGGEVKDDTRLRGALPTLRSLLARRAAVIACSHLGRPKGTPDPRYSLAPVAAALEKLLGEPVGFVPDVVGEEARSAAAALEPGRVLLLENLRFHPGEKSNDPEFADALAGMAEAYVDDAFGTLHRAHASVVGAAERLEHRAAGLLVHRELEAFARVMEGGEHPVAALLGGAKVRDKIPILENLLERVDHVCIGGGMAFTFLAALGHTVGDSLLDLDSLPRVEEIIRRSRRSGVMLHLPTDVVMGRRLEPGTEIQVTDLPEIPEGWMGLDIGPLTREIFSQAVREARTVVWNGPMGAFEVSPFHEGTAAVARAVAESPAFSLVGGGDSVAALAAQGLQDRIDHISTGGGAGLSLLAGEELPGLAVLTAAAEEAGA